MPTHICYNICPHRTKPKTKKNSDSKKKNTNQKKHSPNAIIITIFLCSFCDLSQRLTQLINFTCKRSHNKYSTLTRSKQHTRTNIDEQKKHTCEKKFTTDKNISKLTYSTWNLNKSADLLFCYGYLSFLQVTTFTVRSIECYSLHYRNIGW